MRWLSNNYVHYEPRGHREASGGGPLPDRGRSRDARDGADIRNQLVGEQHLDVAEILDRHEPFDQHLPSRQLSRPVERLTLTMAGTSCGVIPIAIRLSASLAGMHAAPTRSSRAFPLFATTLATVVAAHRRDPDRLQCFTQRGVDNQDPQRRGARRLSVGGEGRPGPNAAPNLDRGARLARCCPGRQTARTGRQ